MRVFSICSFFYYSTAKGGGIEKIKYQDLVRKGYTIIDVRTSEEFAEGHIEEDIKDQCKNLRPL